MKLTSKEKRVNKKYIELNKFLKGTHILFGNMNSPNYKADKDYNVYMIEKHKSKRV